jgi:hypothetical protein
MLRVALHAALLGGRENVPLHARNTELVTATDCDAAVARLERLNYLQTRVFVVSGNEGILVVVEVLSGGGVPASRGCGLD